MGTPTKEAKTRRLKIEICDTGQVLHLHNEALGREAQSSLWLSQQILAEAIHALRTLFN